MAKMTSPYGLVVIVGATGNQGGSVARRFLRERDRYGRVVCLTRNPDSPPSRTLADLGAEVVRADLDDVDSLKAAFRGANVIFSVTNYWEPFFPSSSSPVTPDRRRHAYDVEYAHGKNIADAAAATAVNTLADNGFVASTLSSARVRTGGEMRQLYHFDAKADVFPDYVAREHPRLAGKMSCVETGFFMSSWRIVPSWYFRRVPGGGGGGGGGFEMNFPTRPDARIPLIDINRDLGNFVHAVLQMPPGRSYAAEGSRATWVEWTEAWRRLHPGTPYSYVETPTHVLETAMDDTQLAGELCDMFVYSSSPGYDGGNQELLRAENIRAAGIECRMTTMEEWMQGEDWTPLFADI